MNILEINNLRVNFKLPEKTVQAVRDLNLVMKKGETLGLVGESGCGKTVTAYSILNLIKKPGIIDSGTIIYNNQDLTKLDNTELQKVRGKEISMIFQEPMTSLNPVFKIGYQINESIKLHLNKTTKEAKELSIDLLNEVGIPNPTERYKSYPHELSGGMRQRVMIAMALAANPKILIADEPTTALDVTIQAQILELILKIQRKHGTSVLMISHDLGIVANMAQNIAIMYAGEIIESGSVDQVYNNHLHPYTKGLFEAIPKIGKKAERLKTIPGTVPTITQEPKGCVFYKRCSFKSEECLKNKVNLREIENGHYIRCIKDIDK